eukprot:s6733_g4.t2
MKTLGSRVAHFTERFNPGEASEWQRALAAVEPNQLCLSAGIFAAANACEWEVALALLQNILGTRMSPDGVSWSTAISACEKSSRWQLASYLLVSMSNAHVSPDEYSFNSAIAACERELCNSGGRVMAPREELSFRVCFMARRRLTLRGRSSCDDVRADGSQGAGQLRCRSGQDEEHQQGHGRSAARRQLACSFRSASGACVDPAYTRRGNLQLGCEELPQRQTLEAVHGAAPSDGVTADQTRCHHHQLGHQLLPGRG